MTENAGLNEIIEGLEGGSIDMESVPEELHSNREVLIAAIASYSDFGKGNPIKFAPDEMLADQGFMLEASANSEHGIYAYGDDSWNPEVDGPLAWASKKMLSDKQFMLEVIRQSDHGYDLFYASESLKDDRELVLEAIRKSGDALQYASDELRADKGLILKALQQEDVQTSDILPFAADSLRSDQTFMNDFRDKTLSGFINEVKRFNPDNIGTKLYYRDFTMMVECSGFAEYRGQILIRYQESPTTWIKSIFPNKKIKGVENIEVEFSEKLMPVSTYRQLEDLKQEVEAVADTESQATTEIYIDRILQSIEASWSGDEEYELPYTDELVPWYHITQDDEYVYQDDIETNGAISRTFSDSAENLLETDQWQSWEYEYPITFVDRKYDIEERQSPILRSVNTAIGSTRFYLISNDFEYRFLLTFDEIKKILVCLD